MKVRPSSHAFALPFVLLIIVAITVLVTGLFLSITRERAAARTMTENEKAKLVAHAALEHATALLDNIPQPKPPQSGSLGASINALPNVNWITSPGLLTLVEGSQVTEIPLSSNPSASYTPTATDADLNSPLLETDSTGNPIYPIIPAASGVPVPLRTAWVNLLADPSQPASKDNPIVARYAFWIDDESTKLNVNCALGKPTGLDFSKPNPLMTDPLQGFTGTPAGRATNRITVKSRTIGGAPGSGPNCDVNYPLWHFTSENIRVLDTAASTVKTDELASAIHNAISLSSLPPAFEFRWKPLATPAEIGAFLTGGEPDKEEFLHENLFHLTATGRSPEFNAFGKSRLFWERQMPILDNSLFHQLDYDQDGMSYTHAGEVEGGRTADPRKKWYPNVSGFAHAAWNIAHLLTRADWPGMPARSFVNKWGGNAAALREADQVAWNMTAMAAYSAGLERITSGDNLAEGHNPTSPMLRNRALHSLNAQYGVANATRVISGTPTPLFNPNFHLHPGILSGKAILPWFPTPQINEIALCLQFVDVNPALPSGDPNDKFWVRLWLEVDIQFGGPLPGDDSRRMPTAHYGGTTSDRYRYRFALTDVEYSIQQDGMAAAEIGKQELPQATTSPGGLSKLDCPLLLPPLPPQPDVFSGDYLRIVGGVCAAAKGGNTLFSGTSATKPALAAVFAKDKRLKVDFKFRMAFGYLTNPPDAILQLIPVWDNREQAANPANTYFVPPPGESDRLGITMEFDPTLLLDAAGNADPSKVYIRSLEIADSRLGGNSSAWTPFKDWDGSSPGGAAPPETKLDGHRLGQSNFSEQQAGKDKTKIAYFDFLNASYGSVFPRGSIGMLSVIPTGMQRGIPYDTFKFQPSAGGGELPDWLVLDLFAPALQPFAFMHGVMGKINPNASLTPASSAERWKPLQALVENCDYPGTSGAPSSLVNNILNYSFAGIDFGAQGRYDYVGELCEVQGFADQGGTDWNREGLIRNLANLLTTKSNSFTVWGIAQVVRKSGKNTGYGAFEAGDRIVGEKRFQALVERSVWPGVDGVPGNATTQNGLYTKVAQPAGYPDYDKSPTGASPSATLGRWIGDVPWASLPTPVFGDKPNYPISGATWPVLDGPDTPTYQPLTMWPGGSGANWGDVIHETTPLEQAANPVRAWMRSEIVGFDFLDQ